MFFAIGLASGQESTAAAQLPDPTQSVPAASADKRIAFDDFVDSMIRQEHRLAEAMRSFHPVIETYIQEEGKRQRFQAGVIPDGDDYFLSTLDMTGNSLSTIPLANEQTWKRTEEDFVQDPLPFSQAALAQALFPDLDRFDRQNYTFEFVRWEMLGEMRCAAVDVRPRRNLKNRGFVGRVWAEDQDYNIVRFTGTFTSKGLARRAFHFDSWRMNMPGDRWMPAYVYTQESDPHDRSSHGLWFKAQTRLWGYGLGNTDDHRENVAETTDPSEIVVKRAQDAGLMAPDGDVDQILQTVVNNLLITNNLDIADIRCRVLLTTPLESFVMGRTIVLSRGLIDVLPDEATLAAVLAHELAHVVLGHSVSPTYLRGFAWPFPSSEIFAALDFHFEGTQEEDANKKAWELFSKSPYKDKSGNVGLFLHALDANAARFPNLLHGRFSDDFRSNHLLGMQARLGSPTHSRTSRLNQTPALPIGSRIVVDAWSDRTEMLKSKPISLTPAEKIPFEVTPFYPHLKRWDAQEKPSSGARQ